jgi:hypothetical protein
MQLKAIQLKVTLLQAMLPEAMQLKATPTQLVWRLKSRRQKWCR